jgi:predicted dehydrogenase
MRFHPNQALLRLVMDEGLLGDIMRYDWEYGTAWQGNTQSGFYFSHAQAGGGILIDFGHQLRDRIIDWFGPVEQVEYQDDNWGRNRSQRFARPYSQRSPRQSEREPPAESQL